LRTGFIGLTRELIYELRHYQKSNYSQFNEQETLSRIVQQPTGIYVDVGAGRPITGSNSFFLYRRGWVGICIDPIRNNQILHKILRPRDIFLKVICGRKAESVFYLFNPYEYSTTLEQVAINVMDKYGDEIKLISRYPIASLSLSEILRRQEVKQIDFLNIDTEGADLEVLKSLDWSVWKPLVIAIEAWPAAEKQVADYLFQLGYQFVQSCGPTLIFKL
jgi:FkbM family methyltransferase